MNISKTLDPALEAARDDRVSNDKEDGMTKKDEATRNDKRDHQALSYRAVLSTASNAFASDEY
jgi:hypothetical protein